MPPRQQGRTRSCWCTLTVGAAWLRTPVVERGHEIAAVNPEPAAQRGLADRSELVEPGEDCVVPSQARPAERVADKRTDFVPADHHEQVLDTMLGQVVAWAGALAPLRAA